MATRVARYQADRTNQKLYFVRLNCQLAEQSDDVQLKQCHLESAILHLYGGYMAFLQEITRYYNLQIAEPNLEKISEALEIKTQVSPEVVRLTRLKQNDFLGEIIQAWQSIQYKPAPTLPPQDTPTEQIDTSWVIPVFDVMKNEPLNKASQSLVSLGVSIDMVRQWREQLIEVIDSLREGMIEF